MPVGPRGATARGVRRALALLAAGAAIPACTEEPCGPAHGVVDRIVDGDTIDLADGHRIRYLLVDTPEISGMAECYGPEAAEANRSLVEGREVDLEYDEVCRDAYDRLLAYVSVGGREINLTLVERGYACVLEIPPNGADRADAYRTAEQAAKDAGAGLWGVCSPPPC